MSIKKYGDRKMGFTLRNIKLQAMTLAKAKYIKESVAVHGVVVIPGQNLTPQGLHDFTENLGQVVDLTDGTEFGERDELLKTVVRVSNLRKDGTVVSNHKGAIDWHTDSDFLSAPHHQTYNLLYAEVIPETGGETLFADCQSACQFLSLKERNDFNNTNMMVRAKDLDDFSDNCNLEVAKHPMIYVNPVTGKESIYASGPTDIIQIEGKSKEEAFSIMEDLHAIITQQENVYKHKYKEGDVVIWDNTSTLHRSAGNYQDQPRLLFRSQVCVA